MDKKLVIGSRGSNLALTQSNMVRDLILQEHPDLDISIKIIVTTGDKHQNVPMIGQSLKVDFVKEIEKGLLEGDIDFAVHSMKDMPINDVPGLVIGATPARADYRDVLLFDDKDMTLRTLPEGAVIGTSSLRRGESMKQLRPDCKIKPIRGNVETRMRKLKEEDYDAIVLAAAGLQRLGMLEHVDAYLTEEEVMPAPAQGILGIQCRDGDERVLKILSSIHEEQVGIIAKAERRFAKIFDGGCHTPMGCHGEIHGDKLILKGMYVHEGNLYKGSIEGKVSNPMACADELAEQIWRQING